MKKGFTLIELVFVIIITALIATLGINLFFDLYTNYLRSKAINNLSAEVDNALDRIESRLSYRVRGAVVGRSLDDGTFVDVASVTNQYQILEWLGSSVESQYISDKTPGWSGLVDVVATDTQAGASYSYFVTPGSKVTLAKNIISNLYNGGVDTLGIVFKGVTSGGITKDEEYGFDGVNAKAVFSVNLNSGNNEHINVNTGGYTPNQEFNDQYYLVHTAYALVPGNTISPSPEIVPYYTLSLFYNYQPWMKQNYLNNGSSSIMAEYVTQFRFTTLNPQNGAIGDSNALLLRLCIIDGGRSLGNTPVANKRLNQIANTEICKSRVVF